MQPCTAILSRFSLSRWATATLLTGWLLLISHAVVAAPTPAPSTARLADLPLPAQAAISATLGRETAAYHAVAHGQVIHLNNPRHHLSAEATPAGVRFTSHSATWELRYQGVGYGSTVAPTSAIEPVATANRVEYRRGALTEWYVNGPMGIQQGFTLTAPPGRRMGTPLALTFALSGELQAQVNPDGAGLTLTQDAQARLTYQGLTAWDATGRALPATLRVDGATLALQIDDTGARYPVTIDPFVQLAKLTASDGAAYHHFGTSVAISGDTVVVGAAVATIDSNTLQGAAYVFVKPGTGWAGALAESAKLTASDGAAGDRLGGSVTVSGDTVVVGAIGANSYQGAAYVFVKPGGGWTGPLTESAKLTASGGVAGDQFGYTVTISADTVVVATPWVTSNSNASQGAAYVFVKPGSGWAGALAESAKLTASDGAAGDNFGTSVAISGDTAVVGALGAMINSNTAQGAAYVFVKPGSGWAGALAESAKLTASDGAANDFFGSSVAISGDAVVVGAGNATIGGQIQQGAAYIFGTGFTLTVTSVGTGTGTVISNPAGVDCGGTCSSGFNAGTSITLSATPDPGSTSAGWTGDCAPNGTVTMDADKSCTATFDLDPAGPDLTGTWNGLRQMCIGRLRRCTLMGSLTAGNQGTAPAPRTSVLRFYLSSDGTTRERLLRQVTVRALSAGQSQAILLIALLPTGSNATGKYVIGVLDVTNVITENDETNNEIVYGPIP